MNSSKDIFAALSTSDERKVLRSPHKAAYDALSGEDEFLSKLKLSDKSVLTSSEEVYVPDNYRSSRRAKDLPLENNKNIKLKKCENENLLEDTKKKQNCSIQ